MGLEFTDEQQNVQHTARPAPTGGIMGILIRAGLAKDKQQANIIMIGIIMLMVIIYFLNTALVHSTHRTVHNPNIDPATNLPYGVAAPK